MANEQWQRDKEQKRTEREAKQFMRRMAGPIARGEMVQFGEVQAMHIASLALALEALEQLLIERNVLKTDELMELMKALADKKQEQAAAEYAAKTQGTNLIAEA